MTKKLETRNGTGAPRPGQFSETQKSADPTQVKNYAAAMQRLFSVKKHDATQLHYDFRLSHNGALLSWAIPDGPSYWPGDEREAIQVKDHSLEYAFSERVIYEGPGAGTLMQWDWGTWVPLPGYADVDACMRNGLLKFALLGEKLKGNWTLARVKLYARNRPNVIWTLTKEQDSFARTKAARSILEEAPNSIITGRTMKAIAEDPNKSKYRDKDQGKLFEE